MDFLKFLISKLFWKNLALAVLIIFVAFVFMFIFLRIYTRHGQALSVPNLRGLSIEEAKEVLTRKKLTLQIIDSVYNNIVPRGLYC